MTLSNPTVKIPSRRPPAVPAALVGEVVYIFGFDIAYEMKRETITTLLGYPVAVFEVDASRHSPRQLLFYRPQMVRLPTLEMTGPGGPVRVEQSVKILPVGAISITVRVPFRVDKLDDLLPYHDLRFSDGAYLYDQVYALAERVRRELRPYAVRPVDQLAGEEAYTVFCVNAPMMQTDGEPMLGETFFRRNRSEIAALLTEERDGGRLSRQEARESTSRRLSYYKQDLVVVDWDAAIVIDEPKYFNETLHIMELANVQLTELEAYDRLLDKVVDRSYRDVTGRPRWLPGKNAFESDLREIRIDLARLSDELFNTTKFFGDWHLARVYQHLSARFHLEDWQKSVDEKLRTLDELYQMLSHARNNRWLLVLEFTMTLLFIIDVVILVVLGVR